MHTLETLAHLKSLAISEEQKANGSFTMEVFWAWCNYNNALDQCVASGIAERK